MKQEQPGKQSGFTLIEILVTMVILATIISSGIYFANIGDRSENINVLSMELFLHRNMPSALLSAYQSNGNSFVGVTKSAILASNDVSTTTPTDLSWSVTGTPTTTDITIRITTGSTDEATRLHSQIDTNGYISAAAPDGIHVDVTYSLN